MQKRGLGRGLESLIPNLHHETEVPLLVDDEPGARLQHIPVSKIVPNPNQPRKHFDEGSFAELLSSVREHGLIQPVVVRAIGALYELIVGERRWRAAKEAGLATVPAIVRTTTDIEALELAIIENVQRQDLNPLEEAAAYYHLMEDFGFTQEQLAERVGKNRSTIANTIRLIKLPEQVKNMIVEGKLSAGHARALLSVPREELQLKLAERVVQDGLTVRQTESLAKLWLSPTPQRHASVVPIHVSAMAKSLSKKFAARVRVKMRGDKGRLEIHFASEDELERIIAMLSDDDATSIASV